MEKTQDTLDYDGKAPGDLPRTAATETRGRASAYANASMNCKYTNTNVSEVYIPGARPCEFSVPEPCGIDL